MIEEYSPWTGDEDLDHIQEALESGWVSPRGDQLGTFEDEMAERLGADHAIAVDSGTAALHLTLLTADLPEGAEVIVPDFTYCATALAVSQAGYRPVFADIDRETLSMTAETAHESITPHTEAIITAHLAGRFPDPSGLRDLADEHGLVLIEDAAQSLGAHRDGTYAGTAGDLGAFSFSWNKPITTGKGGMLVTDDTALAERAQQFADYGIDPDGRFELSATGYNYRMDSIRAGLGRSQLRKLDAVIEGRQRVAERYRELLGDVLECKTAPHTEDSPEQFYCFSKDAADLVERLQDEEIGARPLYPPIHSMELYDRDGTFPVTREVSRTGVALPTSPRMTMDEVEHVADMVRDHLK